MSKKSAAFYDHYDYLNFWLGRDYENKADLIALNNLLRQADGSAGRVIEVGSGLGRLVPCYAKFYEHIFLLDPSAVQLKRTEKEITGHYPNVQFVQGVAEQMPFAGNFADAIICIRVSHHLENLSLPISEFMRVLAPGGYLVFDVANKLHLKARVKALFKGRLKDLNSMRSIHVRGENSDSDTPFFNHNPKYVEQELKEAGFEIIAVRSVSNFRSPLLKKFIPIFILVNLERLTQKLLALFWFGPSIFFLVKKPKC